MKLSKVKKALNTQNLKLYTDGNGDQWLASAHAAYLMDRDLTLTQDNLLAVLDVDEDKRADWVVTEMGKAPACLDQCPQEGCDELLIPIMSVCWLDELITIMRTDDGALAMVKQSQIAPADGKEPLTFMLRRSVDPDTGEVMTPVVACFRDMLACAMLAPIKPDAAEKIMEKMRACAEEGLAYCVESEEETT